VLQKKFKGTISSSLKLFKPRQVGLLIAYENFRLAKGQELRAETLVLRLTTLLLHVPESLHQDGAILAITLLFVASAVHVSSDCTNIATTVVNATRALWKSDTKSEELGP
jgi:hypothetical protein